jgi:hypothetical protein
MSSILTNAGYSITFCSTTHMPFGEKHALKETFGKRKSTDSSDKLPPLAHG